ELRATAVLLDGPIALETKIPVALDARAEFDRAKAGQIPDLAQPFDAHGAKHDPTLARVRDDLVAAIKDTITRAFRSSFLLCAACRLHTTREQLVLSLDGKGRWNRRTIDVAVRAGLLRAVDEAVRRGDIPSLLAPLVRGVVRRAPVAALVEGGIRLRDLIG